MRYPAMTSGDDSRLADAAGEVEVTCLTCGRTGAFAPRDDRIDGLPLVTLTRRFRCSACGSRAVKAQRSSPRDIARRLSSRLRTRGE
jgi:DNA-directed RNA polymerase subunit RPC12/RpoP